MPDKISQICQLTEYEVLFIHIYGLNKKDFEQLNSEFLDSRIDVSKMNKSDLTVKVNVEQIKSVMNIVVKYDFDELTIWDTLDKTKNSDSKFSLNYWKREYSYFELYLHPALPNLEQMKQTFL